MNEPTNTQIRPTNLGRFVVLLESSGYTRCMEGKLARWPEKQYAVIRNDGTYTIVRLVGSREIFSEFYFNSQGELIGHDTWGQQ